jgi:hypothetical protein
MYPNNELKELVDKDLSGFKIIKTYLIKLKHNLMGLFPALLSEFDEPFLCETPDIVKQVAEFLEPRNVDIDVVWVLYYPALGYGFDLSDFKISRKCLLVINSKCLSKICKKKKPFKWAYGLISLREEPDREAFSRQIDYLLKELIKMKSN